MAKFFTDGALILAFALLSPLAPLVFNGEYLAPIAKYLSAGTNITMVCPTSKLDCFNSPLVFVVFNWHRSLQPYPAPTLLHSSFSISKHFDKPDLQTNEVPPWRRSRPQSPLVKHIFWSLISKDPTFDFTYNPHYGLLCLNHWLTLLTLRFSSLCPESRAVWYCNKIYPEPDPPF